MLERQSAGKLLLDALHVYGPAGRWRRDLNMRFPLRVHYTLRSFEQTYDELMSSGSFDLTENEKIRTGLYMVRKVGHLSQWLKILSYDRTSSFTVEVHVLFTNIKPYDVLGRRPRQYDIGELCKNRKIAAAVCGIKLMTIDRFYAYQALDVLTENCRQRRG